MASKIKILWRSNKRREFSLKFSDVEVIVLVTASPSLIEKWLDDVSFEEKKFVGIGVQWTRYAAAAETLQICANNKCLIIQLSHCSRFPRILTGFLHSDTITFAGIWNNKDSRKLLSRNHDLEITNLVDVRKYVEGFGNASVPDIVKEGLGINFTPSIDILRSKWNRKKLHRSQITQATIDAYVSCKLAEIYVKDEQDED
ncbi:unnamed protein product [Cochlearia groenlandica]